jgi:hypothetical protein
MNGFPTSALAAALVLVAAACGSPTGPEEDLSRFLPVIDESTITLPDSVQLAVPFDVHFLVLCPSTFDVVFDLEYYARGEAVVLPSCVGDTRDLAGTQDEYSPSRPVQVEVDFEASAITDMAAVTVFLVGRNGTFERRTRVVE